MDCNDLNENNYPGNSMKKHKKEKLVRHWILKFVYGLLASIGILISKRNIPVCACACVYHTIRVIHVFRIILCMSLRNNTAMDISIIASDVVLITLWWSLFLKRHRLYNFIISLLKQYTDCQVHQKKTIIWIFFSLTVCPILTDVIRKLIVGEYYYKISKRRDTCMNYWVSETFQYFSATVFVIEISVLHTYLSVFYVATFLYCCTCLLILQKFTQTSHELSEMWIKCCNMTHAMKKFERIFALPVFLVFIRIAFDTCILVLMYAENSIPSSRTVHFYVTSLQRFVWVICIVFIAEAAQKRCTWFINLVFRNVGALKRLGISVNTFDYKRMISDSTLTAWDMCILKRNVLLTAIASLVTYSVIILDLKNNG